MDLSSDYKQPFGISRDENEASITQLAYRQHKVELFTLHCETDSSAGAKLPYFRYSFPSYI